MSIENYGYPCTPGVGGIHFDSLFNATTFPFAGEIKGASGRVLQAWCSKNAIELLDKEKPGYRLMANTYGFENLRIIAFELKSMGHHEWESGDLRHPDLYGRSFMRAACTYFGSAEPIDLVQTEWNISSINYVQFMHALYVGKSYADAARLTWTGKAVAELGFTHIDDQDVHPIISRSKGNTVYGVFSAQRVAESARAQRQHLLKHLTWDTRVLKIPHSTY